MKMKFKIYQLRDMRGTDYGFMGWDFAKDHGFTFDDYLRVYEMETNTECTLDDIFVVFNMKHPKDFHGHSLSVSDIVAMKKGDGWKWYYCDSFGWEDITDHIKPKKKKFRVWARSIDHLFVDIEAERKEDAKEAAKKLDGSEFHDDCFGEWEWGSVAELDDDADVDYTYDEIVNPE